MGEERSARSHRAVGDADDAIRFGPFSFELSRSRLCREGVDVYLTPKAAAVLGYLLRHPGELITKDKFLDVVWEGVSVREESLTQAISVIRRAIGDSTQSPRFIETISGEGYRFIGAVHGAGAGDEADAERRAEAGSAVETPGDVLPAVEAAGAGAPLWPRLIPWGIAAAAILVAVLGYRQSEPDEARWPIYTNIALDDPPAELSIVNNSPLALSPDGTLLVYKYGTPFTAWGGSHPLLLRDLRDDSVTPIRGTEGAGSGRPFFSPDGAWLGFFADLQLKKIRIDGSGEAVPLCDAPSNGWTGGAWGPDDRIVYGLPDRLQKGLQSADPEAPGECGDFTILDTERGETSHRWPQVLPNGKGMLFTVNGERYYNAGDIVVYSFETERRHVVARGTQARFAPTNGVDDGHLLVARDNTLFAAPFDAERLQTTGPEVPVVPGLYTATVGFSGSAHFAISDNGHLVYREAIPPHDRRVVLVDLEGNPTPLSLQPHPYEGVRFSPDGRTLALVTAEGEVYRSGIEVGRPQLVTGEFEARGFRRTPRFSPAWHPDGKRLALYTQGIDLDTMFLVDIDGARAPLGLPSGHGDETFVGSLLREPDRLLYWFTGSKGGGVRELEIGSGQAPREVMDRAGHQSTLSADGLLLAHTTGGHVFVRHYAGTGPGEQVSIVRGRDPVWGGAEGRTIYFRDHRNGAKLGGVWAADVSTEPTLEVGPPRRLFDDRYYVEGSWRPRAYDLSPDGQHFVMLEDVQPPARTERFQMIRNFFEILRRDAPAGR